MSDIVEQLRTLNLKYADHAADEIERLRAELDSLKATPPSIPAGYQIIDTALLQRASWAIGRFIEGGDWTQEDMDCMDDLDAHLCRAITTPPSAPEALDALDRLYRWSCAMLGCRVVYTGDHPIAVAERILAAPKQGELDEPT